MNWKKIIIWTLVILVIGIIIYFVFFKSKNTSSTKESLVQAEILNLTAQNKGANNFGFTSEEWVRRTAISNLLNAGTLTFEDLNNGTQKGILDNEKSIRSSGQWLSAVQAKVPSQYPDENAAVRGDAIYMQYVTEGKNFDI